MKMRLLLLATLVLTLAASVVAVAVSAGQPMNLPHDGSCVSYCARAMVPGDKNGNGRMDSCLRERMCHHVNPDSGAVGAQCDYGGLGCNGPGGTMQMCGRGAGYLRGPQGTCPPTPK